MKKLVIGVVLSILSISMVSAALKPSESALRERVVKLMGDHAMCSGEQVRAPSGEDYILTAAHCRVLAKDGVIDVMTAEGYHIKRRVIAEDPNSDLLLLEGVPGLSGISVARKVRMHEHVRTFTHGGNMDTFKTEGELVFVQHIDAPLSLIQDSESEAACVSMPKNKEVTIDTPFGQFSICVLSVDEVITTARIIPGSSGGMAVNDSGQLVGVASVGNSTIGGLVKLSDIQNFLGGY